MTEWKNISCKIKGKSVLNNVSLLANDGEITVIVGKNGSGKTTLLHSLFLTRGRGFRGKIFIDGKNINEFSKKELGKRICLMPQNLPKVNLKVSDLVYLGRTLDSGAFGTLSVSDKKKADEAIEAFGLDYLKDRYVWAISGGERQSAYFAMALAKDAQNIFLDEPASSLDAPRKSEISLFVKSLRESGKCVVIVMHDLTEAVNLADKIYVMNDGKLSLPMTPREFEESDIPAALFSSRAYKLNTEHGVRTVFLSFE